MTSNLTAEEPSAIYKVLREQHRDTRSLRSLGTWSGGGTPSKENAAFWTNGTIPWVSPKDMKVERVRTAEDHITLEAVTSSATSLVKAGAVVMVVRSGILKHSLPVAVTEVDVALNQDMKALQPAAGVDAAYVAWALRANASHILRECTKEGTTVQSIEFPALLDFAIPLPVVDIQRKVVGYVEEQLSRLDASVAALLRAQANLKRYRASLLKAACEGRLVPTEAELARAENRVFENGGNLLQRILSKRRREEPAAAEPTKPDVRDLSDLPDAWIWTSADQLLNGIEAGKSFKCEERPPHDDEVGVLKVSAVSWSEFNEEESKTCTEVEKVDVRYMVKPGDFLFSRANTIDLVGACVIVNDVRRRLMLSDKTLRLSVSEAVIPKWLLYCLRSKLGRGDIERLSTGNQESMRNIGQARIRQIRIPLPPLAEQHRIVAEADRRLSLIRAAEAQVTANLARAKRLRQSILQAAFSPGANDSTPS